jgi:hypothetical protein
MRHLRVTFGLAAMVCTFAVAATPALAHEFVSSREGNTKGKSYTEQYLKLGPFKITCEKAQAAGKVVAGSSPILTTVVKFGRCGTKALIGVHEFKIRTRVLVPLAIEYHQNGWIKTGSQVVNVGGQWVAGGSGAVFKVHTGTNEFEEKSECEIIIPPQTVPSEKRLEKEPEAEFEEASFLNKMFPHKVTKLFPEGEQPGIEITNTVKGLHYEFEGEPCEEWGHEEEPEGGAGVYQGSFPQVVGRGNLEFL